MKRLIERGLMFGNLIHVSSPALLERYNRAMQHLTGQTTDLTDFHIDMSGYSPEIGDALGDHFYLNHKGVNRQFILLTTDQKRCPLLNIQFSNSRDILRQFIEANETQLFALTATDAVAGELVNSVFDLTHPSDLFDIRTVTIEADTTQGTLRHADELAGLVDRFRSQEDAWFDDVLISRMITLAGKTGDVARNPVRLGTTRFEQRNFWTAHFGGIYVFQDVEHPAMIAADRSRIPDDVPIAQVLDLGQPNQIAQFLEVNALAEPIIKARGLDTAAVLRQKMDFIIVDAAASQGMDLSGLTRTDMRRIARQNSSVLPDAYWGLAALVNWATDRGPWPHVPSDHPAYFYTLRAAETAGNSGERDLVNMLLAELTLLDFRQLFICHKALFYKLYATWPDAKKTYVADFLAREYQVDKAGARAALFGHEPDMTGKPAPQKAADLIRRVGPWGAIGRT